MGFTAATALALALTATVPTTALAFSPSSSGCETATSMGMFGILIGCGADFPTPAGGGTDPPIFYDGNTYQHAAAQGVAKSCSGMCQSVVDGYVSDVTEACGTSSEGKDAISSIGFILPKCSVPGISKADKKCFKYMGSLDVSSTTEAENYVYEILKSAGDGASSAALKAALEASKFNSKHLGGSCKVIELLDGWSDMSSCAPASELCKCGESTMDGLEMLYDIVAECGNSHIMSQFELPSGTATGLTSALKILGDDMKWLTTVGKPLDTRTAAETAGIPDKVKCLRTVSCAEDTRFTSAVAALDGSLGSVCGNVKASCDAASRCRAGDGDDGDCECVCSVFSTKVTLQGDVDVGAKAEQALAAKFEVDVSDFSHTFEDGVLTLDYSVDFDHVADSVQMVDAVINAQAGDANALITQTLQQSDAGSELGDFQVTDSSAMTSADQPKDVPVQPLPSSGDSDSFFSTGGGYAVIGLLVVASLGAVAGVALRKGGTGAAKLEGAPSLNSVPSFSAGDTSNPLAQNL